MPKRIDEIKEDPAEIFNVEIEIIEVLEQNDKFGYTETEIYDRMPMTKNLTIPVFANMSRLMLTFILQFMWQKGLIRKGTANGEKYYFAFHKTEA